MFGISNEASTYADSSLQVADQNSKKFEIKIRFPKYAIIMAMMIKIRGAMIVSKRCLPYNATVTETKEKRR